MRGNFCEADKLLKEGNWLPLQGALWDLGVSSLQLEDASRGFSLQREGPLDMRMDPETTLRAGEIINHWPEEELRRVFSEYGEERRAAAIAHSLIQRRQKKPFESTLELAQWIAGRISRRGKTHPATRIFMALRILVNDELENLRLGMERLQKLLAPGGRFLVISFHSLEDRIVKNTFRTWSANRRGKLPFKKPLRADPEEARIHPTARSAKLRVLEGI